MRPFDLGKVLAADGGAWPLFEQHVNPRMVRLLRLIGFDRRWVRGEGPYLWDDRGRKVLDCLAGYAMLVLGRNHPVVRDALEQCLRAAPPGFVQLDAPALAGALAADLKRRVPLDDGFVFFTNSGTEGIEAAIKFARAATGRPTIVYCTRGFHGLAMGSLSINGTATLRAPFGPLLADVREVPFNDRAALEAALRPGDVAAFVVEPVQGKTLAIADATFLGDASSLCRRHGALLVADEVQTGVGRSGRFVALSHDRDARPDIVVLSKALSGGFVPVGAVITRGDVWRRVFAGRDRALVHSSTFHMGPLAMTAAMATLHVHDELNLGERAGALGDDLLARLRQVAASSPLVRDVRGRGLMIGIELDVTPGTATRLPGLDRMRARLLPQLFAMTMLDAHGVLCQATSQGSPVIKLVPPLVIDESDVAWIERAVAGTLAELPRRAAALRRLAQVARNAMR